MSRKNLAEERTREDLLFEIAELRARLASLEASGRRSDQNGGRGEQGPPGSGGQLHPLKPAERGLRETEEQLRVLFDSAPVGMIVVDPVDLKFLQVNRKALELPSFTRRNSTT